MIITISGSMGSGKTSVAREVAAKLGYRFYSVGDLMGEIAKKRGMSLLELSQFAEKTREIDDELDRMQVELGKKDNIVMDSRLGFHFLPGSVKIFLKCTSRTGAKRIFKQLNASNKERSDEKENTTLELTEENIRKRLASEKKRYSEYYGLADYTDPANYDLVIETDSISIQETVNIILDFLKKLSLESKKASFIY